MNEFFSLIRLGTQAYFDNSTRDRVEEKDYIIKMFGTTEHFVVTNRKTGKQHLIPIYNVSYAEFREAVKDERDLPSGLDSPIALEKKLLAKQNDSVKESPREDSARESGNSRENELSNVPSTEKKGKKSKKN